MARKLPTVAIIGQANVGKSSLFNRFVGFNQAIVAREAGTTRDSVIGKVYYGRGGKSVFNLIDTAGLKTAEDEFEASIQDQIADASGAADVILVTVDATKYPTDQDRDVAKKALKSRKPVLLLLNKTDLKGAIETDEYRRLGIKHIFRTSAEHGVGLEAVVAAIGAEIPPTRPEDESDDTLKIALIGRPNVGKSYLFNTLAGKQQAIVANVAGTTRDVNRVRVRFEGRDIEVLDTAGVRRSGKQEVGIEKFGVLRTLSAIDEADICFLLMDANELNVALDQKLAGIIKEAGKGLVLVVSKWDAVEKDAYTRDSVAPGIVRNFDFVPWAPLIFTSSVTGQNVTKLYELALLIDGRRHEEIKTRELNKVLQECLAKHPPAGLKNTHPKLRYMVQTDVAAPWFVIYGSNLKFVHWSYKRYLETQMREQFDFTGTPIKFSFRDEKQMKANRERIAEGRAPRIKNGSESFVRNSLRKAGRQPVEQTEEGTEK